MHFQNLRYTPTSLVVKIIDDDKCVQTSTSVTLTDVDNIDDDIIAAQDDAVSLYVSFNNKMIAYLNAKTEEALALIGKQT